jgi:succinyl-CoA synthetase beta subunit
MHLHEYQAKILLREYGVPIPPFRTAFSVDEAVAATASFEGQAVFLKAQVHAGGRGKAGGVQRVMGADEASAVAHRLLGSRLVTHQSGPAGQPVSALLVTPGVACAREFYLALTVDRQRRRVAVILSAEGGMEIEEVAASHPERLLSLYIHPAVGLMDYQCRRAAFFLGLPTEAREDLVTILHGLYRLFLEKDLSLLELNPLSLTTSGRLLALDAKMTVDDNALFRQEIAEWRDPEQEDPRERRARGFDLNYVGLAGDIGCMVNGAGLAMATMDIIQHHGGHPANFLDVGGGATADKVTEAFKIILADPGVKAILVNIFGGIVRCDLIAEGICRAVREVGVAVPVVVRLEGTNAAEAKATLAASGLALIAAEGLADAAHKVVAAAAGGA